ncbi:MAG: ATP synthase F1 subunit delta [Bryobacteraceae bacterium]
MSLVIASRYAQALVDLVLAPEAKVTPEQAVQQLRTFEEVWLASPELRTSLLSPAVPAANKRAVANRIAGKLGFLREIRNFLFVAIDRRRINLLPAIRQSFETQLDERMGVLKADVRSPLELTPAQREALQSELSQMTGKKVRCEYALDGALLGGVVVRIGSTIYDGSVRGQLDHLRRDLVARA